MKKLILLITIMAVVSCHDTSVLEKKIKDLEAENKQLKANSKRAVEDKVVLSELILMPHALHFKKGKKNTVTGVIYQQQEYPPFDLYIADKDLSPAGKIAYRITKEKKIEFDYIPTSQVQESLKVLAVFKNGSNNITLYGFLDLPVK